MAHVLPIIGGIAKGVAIAGMAVQGVHVIQQARVQKKVLEQNAEIARKNAALAEEELEYNIRQREQIGKRKTGIAKASAFGTGGIPGVDTLANPAVQTTLDIINMKRTGQIDIANYLQRSQSLKFEGGRVLTGGIVEGVGHLARAGGTLAGAPLTGSTMLKTQPAPKPSQQKLKGS